MAFRRQFRVTLKRCLDCPTLVETRCRRRRCEPCSLAHWREVWGPPESTESIEATYQRALADVRRQRMFSLDLSPRSAAQLVVETA